LVLDAAELRAMDTTIWAVRERRSDDSSDRFIAARPAATEALSAQPIEARGEWLLHLTDPHYSLGGARDHHAWRLEGDQDGQGLPLVDAIHSAIRRDEHEVGAIVVTGDLTYRGSESEFATVRTALFKLTNGLLGLGTEHLVIVPGNHDIVWTNTSEYQYDEPVSEAPAEATKNYRKFFNDLMRTEASQDLSMTRRFIFPGGNLIDIAAVNSSSLEQGKSFLAGMGRVQEHAYREAATALAWHNSQGSGLRILALHHHLTPTEDLESANEYAKGFGLAVDAPRIQRLAAKDGVHLALHGHKHRAFLWRSEPYALPELSAERMSPLNILGGGSAGSTTVDGEWNYFNLLKYEGSVVHLKMYRSKPPSEFTVFREWTAELVVTADGLRQIGPWLAVDA